MEVAVDQWRPAVETEVEEVVDVVLQGRRSRLHHSNTSTTTSPVQVLSAGNEAATIVNGSSEGESLENGIRLDKSKGVVEDMEIVETLIAGISAQYNETKKEENTTVETVTGEETGKKSEVIEEENEEETEEEEVVELEFERAIPKLHTHTMHCPNCDSNITKVILRRKIIKKTPKVTKREEDPVGLFGCLSCFSLFTPSGNGGFNPFHIFGKRSSTSENTQVSQSLTAGNGGKVVLREQGNCFSMFRVFGKGEKAESAKEPQQTHPGEAKTEEAPPEYPITTGYWPEYDTGNTRVGKLGENHEQIVEEEESSSSSTSSSSSSSSSSGPDAEEETYMPKDSVLPGVPNGDKGKLINRGPSKLHQPRPDLGLGVHQEDVKIDLPTETDGGRPRIGYQIIPSTEEENQTEGAQQDSTSFEILKSIVYGGLMEIIASLSIVASAAASDATTLNIITLALANLIGGILIICHNIWDLRNDCYKVGSSQAANEEASNKYKELLGRVEHFPLHAVFAVLSFLVFGVIPPLAYGFAFHETNDKDYTIAAVAIASLICVGLLAIFKAYINRCPGLGGYVKTVVYYVTTAVSASGVSYVAGNLVTRLMNELGLFETSSGVSSMSLLPDVNSVNPSLAYY